MCNEILLTIGEDGVAREYDDTWDIVIHCESKEEHDAAIKRLTVLEPHWISCKERLPENYVDVLVWFEYYRYGSYNRLYQTYGIGTYSENYDLWTINHESGWHKLRVIAWMPLPEKFKEEGREE